jgi:two-component system, NtrC family, sensor histidine kinase PilS
MAERTSQYTGQIQNVSVVYNIYRIVLPLVLLVTFITGPETSQLGRLDSDLFVQVCIAYAVFGVVMALFSPRGGKFFSSQQLITGSLILDIFAITLLVYTCEGVSSGLGLMLIVTIASGSILIRGRISTFIAAVAALAVMYTELYLSLALEDAPNQFVQAGILGIILFATSLYIQVLTDRIYKAALLADEQASNIIDLEKLNNEIIQRMRTGVVVVSAGNRILSMNSAARTTIEPMLKQNAKDPEYENLLPESLSEQLSLWKINPKRQPQPIVVPTTGKQVQTNFAFLNPESDSDVLIYLEDNRQIVQRVRQMKLASLGRLTASIAHEVRNPLGAISHASQLLKESESIADDDKRMIEIILDHCSRVNMIIEDVLDASRHDDTSSTKVMLKDWLEQFVENYKSTHQGDHHIDLKISPEDIEINVITTQLEQVLNNLFENGLRYSQKATGKSTLTVLGGIDEKEHDQQPYLFIIDDGPGIDEDAEAQLFEPFHTTESTGTGLGLYISKELCEANQSQLVYEKNAKGKSCFSIYFSHPDRSVT